MIYFTVYGTSLGCGPVIRIKTMHLNSGKQQIVQNYKSKELLDLFLIVVPLLIKNTCRDDRDDFH